MHDPKNDGKDHINIYAYGGTELGRKLSNFAHSPMFLKEGSFNSIEAYWYWLQTGDDDLRKLSGKLAKDHGRKSMKTMAKWDPMIKLKIASALLHKVIQNPEIFDMIKSAPDLPLDHYYVFKDKQVKGAAMWVIEIWELIFKMIKEHNAIH